LEINYKNGKEFRLTTEGADTKTRLQEWYKAITKAIDDFKDMKRGGGAKVVISKGGEHDRPDVAVPGKTEYVVQQTPAPASPPVQHVQVVQAPTTTVIHSPAPAPMPMPMPAPAPVMTTVVSPMGPVMGGVTTTYAQPPVMAPMPMMTSYTQPTYPQVTVHSMPAPAPMTMVGPQMISCAFCRNVFQSPGSPVFACPYCRQINHAQPQAVTTIAYSSPPVFM